MDIISRMRQLKHLTSNEKLLVDFILTDPQRFLTMKPKEVSEAVFVSISSLYRLIDKLELSGISHFKVELVDALNKTNVDLSRMDVNFPILESDAQHNSLKTLKDLYAKTIDETMILFDHEELGKIVDRMGQAQQIDIYTSSSNLYFAQNFQFQMQEIGRNVNVPNENYIQRLTAANSDTSHFAIVMSYGGRGVTTQDVVKILKRNQVNFLLISSHEPNPLKDAATYHITMPAMEDHYNKLSSFSTRLSLLYIFDILYALLFHRDYEKNLAFKLQNYSKINTTLK